MNKLYSGNNVEFCFFSLTVKRLPNSLFAIRVGEKLNVIQSTVRLLFK